MKSTLRHLETAKPPESGETGVRLVSAGISVLFHPETQRVGEVAPLVDLGAGTRADVSRLEPILLTTDGRSTEPLGTPYLSRTPFQIEAPTSGNLRVIVPPGSTEVRLNDTLVSGSMQVREQDLEHGVVLQLAKSVVLLLHVMAPPLGETEDLGLLGASVAMRRLRAEIQRLSDVDVPVLLRGETGVGKELVANAINKSSRRSRGPYVCVNMAAASPTMAASLLFGHARGAFTGATRDHDGYFLQAHKGTLFLDEIGDTPLDVQPLLLRATAGEIQVLGEARMRRVDVRMIAATDLDLEEAVEKGDFRGQLQERLAGYELTVPPLRTRRDDVARLLFHFLREELDALDRAHLLDAPPVGELPWMRASLVARLARYDWPRNVRQLRNVARQLAISNRDARRVREDTRLSRLLDEAATNTGSAAPARDEHIGEKRRTPGELSDDAVIEALRSNAYNVSATAAALGASRTWLFTRMDACSRIRKARDLNTDEIKRADAECGGDMKAMALQLEVSHHGLKQRMTELGLSPKGRGGR